MVETLDYVLQALAGVEQFFEALRSDIAIDGFTSEVCFVGRMHYFVKETSTE